MGLLVRLAHERGHEMTAHGDRPGWYPTRLEVERESHASMVVTLTRLDSGQIADVRREADSDMGERASVKAIESTMPLASDDRLYNRGDTVTPANRAGLARLDQPQRPPPPLPPDRLPIPRNYALDPSPSGPRRRLVIFGQLRLRISGFDHVLLTLVPNRQFRLDAHMTSEHV